MEYTTSTRRYELACRFGKDDEPMGFHARDILENFDQDGKKVGASELPPYPITEEKFRELLGAENARMAEATQAAIDACEKHKREAAKAEAGRLGAVAQIATLKEQLSNAIAGRQDANNRIAGAAALLQQMAAVVDDEGKDPVERLEAIAKMLGGPEAKRKRKAARAAATDRAEKADEGTGSTG